MANFNPTLVAETLTGAPGVVDTVDYRTFAVGGVTVDVLNDGTRNTAEGDTYSEIDRFFLTDISGQVDYFFGSDADETVKGFGGSNVLHGGGGNDKLFLLAPNEGSLSTERNVFNGGTGVDTMWGGDGDDRFDIAAGDAMAGEIYRGNAGFDTIRLIAGGTGDTVDLTGASLVSIEKFEFDTDVTLIVNDNQLIATEVQGTAGTGEFIQIDDWDELNGPFNFDSALQLIDSSVDAVIWERGNNTGTTTLTEEIIDQDSGETGYVKTFVNDGANNIAVDTRVDYYNQDFQLFQTVRTNDNGLNITNIYDPVTGTTLEQQFFDLSPGSSAFDFEFRSVINDSTGALTYRITQYDNDVLEEQLFDANDNVTYQLLIDNSLDGSSFTYDSIEEFYESNGTDMVLRSRVTVNDETETDALVREFFTEDGEFDYSVTQRRDGPTLYTGSAGDQTFVSSSNNQVFAGNDGGTDVFIFSGDVGSSRINGFDRVGSDILDLTAYGISSRDDLEDAGALTYDASNGQHVIDVSLIGGNGLLVLGGTQDSDLGNDDFILV